MAKRSRVPLEQRRAELTEVAHAVMARDGAFALTTRALAKEAGVPHGSVHYAFGSKRELLAAVIRSDFNRMLETFSPGLVACSPRADRGSGAVFPLPSDAASWAEDLLRRTCERYAETLIEDPREELAQMEIMLLGAREEEFRSLLVEAHADYRTTVAEFLAAIGDAVKPTGLVWPRSPEFLADELLAHLYGASCIWLLTHDNAALRESMGDVGVCLARRLAGGEEGQ